VSEERKVVEEAGQIDGVEQQADADEEEARRAEIEAEARKVGWMPESEWLGPPPKYGFVGAQTFLERGETLVPILNAKLKGTRAALESLRRSSAQAIEFMADANARAVKERDEAIVELEKNFNPFGAKNWRRPAKTGKKYDDLPEDAKTACDVLGAEGVMTQEEYVKNYAWDE
jgi:hypothetical protein